jgi:hypothetical protein
MTVGDNKASQDEIRSTWFINAEGVRVEQTIGKKGLYTVLNERGLLQQGRRYNKEQLIQIANAQPDFAEANDRVPIVEKFVEDKGHKVVWVPKYHCELNPIELCWNRAKKYTRKHCDYTITGLRKTVPKALDSITVLLIRKFFRLCRDYLRAYSQQTPAGDLKARHHAYKSHRRVFGVKLEEMLGVAYQPQLMDLTCD